MAFLLFTGPAAATPLTKAQCILANESGQDLRRTGQISAARERFETCSDDSCPAIIRSDCALRFAEAQKAQPSVVFEASDSRAAHPIEVEMTVDGRASSTFAEQSPEVKLDPGAHSLTFKATGYEPITKSIHLNAGEHTRIIIALQKLRTESTGSQLEAAPSSGPPWTWRHYTGIALTAVGVTGVIIGAINGYSYLEQRSELDDAIERHPCYQPQTASLRCPAEASMSARTQASQLSRDNANLESGAALPIVLPMALGVAAVAAGIILLAGAGSHSSATSSLRAMPWTNRERGGLLITWSH